MLIFLETTLDQTRAVVYSDQLVELSRLEWGKNANQADDLLAGLDGLVKDKKDKIAGIYVNTTGGSYTSARIVMTIANSLGLALNIQPVAADAFLKMTRSPKAKFSVPLVLDYQASPFITNKKDRL